jgi:hypothetical protein
MSFTGLNEIIGKEEEKPEGTIKKHYMKTQQTGGGEILTESAIRQIKERDGLG